MPVYSVLKSMLGKRVRAVLKQGITLTGRLTDIDTFLNIKLQHPQIELSTDNTSLPIKAPRSIFIRGSSLKCVWMQKENVSMERMERAARRAALYKLLTQADTV